MRALLTYPNGSSKMHFEESSITITWLGQPITLSKVSSRLGMAQILTTL